MRTAKTRGRRLVTIYGWRENAGRIGELQFNKMGFEKENLEWAAPRIKCSLRDQAHS